MSAWNMWSAPSDLDYYGPSADEAPIEVQCPTCYAPITVDDPKDLLCAACGWSSVADEQADGPYECGTCGETYPAELRTCPCCGASDDEDEP